MPTIPSFTSRVGAPGPIPGTIQTAGAVGRGAARLGQQIAQLGAQTLEIKRAQQKKLDDLAKRLELAELDNEFSAERIRLLQDAKASEETDGMTDSALAALDDIADSKLGDITDPMTRGEAQLRYTQKHRGPFEERLLDAENEKRTGQINARLDTALDGLATSIFRDPAGFISFLQQGMDAIDGMAAIAKIPAVRVAERKQEFSDAAVLAQLRGQIQVSPEQMQDRLMAGDFDSLIGDPDTLAKLQTEARTAVSRVQAERKTAAIGTVGEWFRQQPDTFAAAEQMADGNIEDPKVKMVWDALPPDDRASVFTATIMETSRLTTLRNQQREEAERLATEAAEGQVRAFYFDEEISGEGRQAIFEELRNSDSVDLNAVKAMDQFLRSGGPRMDNEADLVAAEREIRNGAVPDDMALIGLIGENDWSISLGTMRTRLAPMIEAQRDEIFTEALQWGLSQLGIPRGGGILGDAFADPMNKGAKLEAELRRFRFEKPEGDFWAFATSTVDRLQNQSNSAALSALPALTQSYREALAGGDARRIAQARLALGTIMVEGGMVSALEAAQGDFDPLAIIEAQKAP